MAKRKAGKSSSETQETEFFPCTNYDAAHWMVENWLDCSKDRASAAQWLMLLFGAKFILAGMSDRGHLMMSDEDSELILLDPATLTASGPFGTACVPHPPCPNVALLAAVRAAALQPAMTRAVGGPASTLTAIPVGVAWGNILVDIEV